LAARSAAATGTYSHASSDSVSIVSIAPRAATSVARAASGIPYSRGQ
jgi:hypothetical protein